MVAVIMIVFVAAALAVDSCLLRRPRLAEAVSRGAEPAAGARPRTLFLHPGHSWVALAADGLAEVGIDDLAPSFVGRLAAVELPKVGTVLRQGAAAWTLVSAKGRRLTQVMPLEGEVVEVNDELLRDPALAERTPYEAGWLLRVRPRHLGDSLRNLLHGAMAGRWLDLSKSRITTRLSPAVGLVATDGGALAGSFGDEIEEADWRALERELFPAA